MMQEKEEKNITLKSRFLNDYLSMTTYTLETAKKNDTFIMNS